MKKPPGESDPLAHDTEIYLLSYQCIRFKFPWHVAKLLAPLLVANEHRVFGRRVIMEAVGRVESGTGLWNLGFEGVSVVAIDLGMRLAIKSKGILLKRKHATLQ